MIVWMRGTPADLALRADDYLVELQRELELVRMSSASGGPIDGLLAQIDEILNSCEEVRSSLRQQAEEAATVGAERFDARLRLPPDAGETVLALQQLLDTAREESERGHLLVLPPQEEVDAFRRAWLAALSARLTSGEDAPLSWRSRHSQRQRHQMPHPPQGELEASANSLRMRLPPELTASRRARKLLRRAEDRWGRAPLFEAAELPLSELVTNAVLHARTPIDVAVCLRDDTLRVEVHDRRPGLHARASREEDSTTGRGLELVGAVVDRWGVAPGEPGKVVWFELEPQQVASA